MADQINDGGPAFPSHGSMGEVAHEGMTLRDYFAAKALPAVIARWSSGYNDGWRGNATIAYAIADAMLKARSA